MADTENRKLDPDEMFAALSKKISDSGMDMDMGRIEAAYNMAKLAHSGQLRKDGSPYVTHCVAAADIAAAIQLVDAEVGDDGNLVAAAVVCHDDLVGQAADAVCLRLQRGDERVAAVVVGRKEYGEGFFQGSED